MKPKHIKIILLSEIKTASENYEKYCYNPLRNFSRNRKLPFETVVKSIIGMESKSLTNELIDIFNSSDMPFASAFHTRNLTTKVFHGFLYRVA